MKTTRTRKSSRVLVGSIALLLAVQSAQAASQVWDGDTSALWSLGTNWVGNPLDAAVPATGDTATFNSAGGADDVINLDGVTINTILFDTASAAAYTIGSGAAGSQTLTLDNAGAVTVNSTVANDQLFNANLILGNDGTEQTFTFTNNSINNLTFAGNITGSSGAGRKTLVVTGVGNTTISGAISGLNGGNPYNGEAGTQVNGGGTLQIGNGGMTGSITGDVFLDNGVLQFNRAGTYTFDGVITDSAYLFGNGGTGSVRKLGAGTLVLTGNNAFVGGTTIDDGILQIGNDGALAGYGLTVNGGELDLHTFNLNVSSLQGSGGVISDESSDPGTTTLYVGQYGTGTGTFGGVIRDGGQGRQVGLSIFSGTLVLSGSNTYSGNTAIYVSQDFGRAVLQFAKKVSLYNNVQANWTAASIYVEGTIAFNVGGPGEFTNGDITDYLLPKLVDGGSLQSGAAIGFDTTNAAGGTFTIADDLSDSGNGPLGVTKLGSGTLVVSGTSNDFTGTVSVNSGTLLVSGSLSGTTSVAVNSTATLGGSGGTIGATATTVNVNAGGTLAPGASIGQLNIGTATETGNTVNFVGSGASKAVLSIELNALSSSSDLLFINGNLNLGADDQLTLTLLNGVTATGSYTIATYTGTLTGTFDTKVGMPSGYDINYGDGSNDSITIIAVPEPGAAVSLLGGLGLLLGVRRRRSA